MIRRNYIIAQITFHPRVKLEFSVSLEGGTSKKAHICERCDVDFGLRHGPSARSETSRGLVDRRRQQKQSTTPAQLSTSSSTGGTGGNMRCVGAGGDCRVRRGRVGGVGVT